ncbi:MULTISPECIES: ParB/RepB/Spo0J family partition protein [unclassified Bdellovibrio]|uniref:ParB/RepB/Spo0J family partition protein n=1 Tax=unclassified Bdellovibrio TaxID=2633795 RepID=UPI0011596641|nr:MULTISPECIES: ParB/RepB/Spo0J family partition protein [unclassified Bdellovibrio]QDK47285.1 chromosome partitioning protein [Bdellovibrio sp. ZAP7]QLY25472.1 ParB/RepB/Spo0J family partition protein [Bdellovibrio sp. KM01]
MSDTAVESSNKKRGLGRGLGSLLGGPANNDLMNAPAASAPPVKAAPANSTTVSPAATAAGAPSVNVAATVAPPVDPESKIWKVAIDKLSPGKYQPRTTFEKEPLQELAQSIKENGILQPIVARRTTSGKLEIVAGERRWRASQLAGLHEVPVILKSYDDKQALELAIVENIQREDLNPIEEAEGYSRLITEFKLSQQQVAEKVGRDRATVANAVRLLALPNEVKDMISANDLSVGHAKVLLSLPEPKKQIEMAKKVVNDKIAVRKLEKMVQAIVKGTADELEVPTFDSNVTQRLINGLSDELQKIMGTKVNIDYSGAKGKISIHFYSDDELTNLVDRLKEGWQ